MEFQDVDKWISHHPYGPGQIKLVLPLIITNDIENEEKDISDYKFDVFVTKDKFTSKMGSICYLSRLIPDYIYCKISYYRMVFAYYLIKIITRLIKKSQQIKTYIFSLIHQRKLIRFIFDVEPPFSEEQIDLIIKSKQYRNTKIFLKTQYYFKLKYIGYSLIFHLNRMNQEKRKYIAKNIEKYFSRLKEDLKYAFYFQNKVKKFAKFEQKYNNYNIIYEKYKRHMYKYFFKSIFPLIYSKLSKFSQKLFKNYGDYQEAKNEYKSII